MDESQVVGYDTEDGIVAHEYLLTHNVQPGTPGVYDIKFGVTDLAGNNSECSTKVYVSAPGVDITAKDLIVKTGYDYVQNQPSLFAPTATDADGTTLPITQMYVLGDENVDTSKPGIYPVTVGARSLLGNTVDGTTTANVVVTDEDIPVELPYIYLYAEDVEVRLNGDYDTSMHNAFAYSSDGVDVTEKIKFNPTTSPTTSTGKFTVQAYVSDTVNGQLTNASRDVNLTVMAEEVELTAKPVSINSTNASYELSDHAPVATDIDGNPIDSSSVVMASTSENSVSDIEQHIINQEEGYYPVTLEVVSKLDVNKKATVDTYVVVQKSGTVYPENGLYISADDVELNEGDNYDTASHNAFAFNYNTNTVVTEQIDYTSAITTVGSTPSRGIYKPEIKIVDGTLISSVSPTVTVTASDVIFTVSNTYVYVDEPYDVASGSAVAYHEVVAVDTLGVNYSSSVEIDSSTYENVAGIYDSEFSVVIDGTTYNQTAKVAVIPQGTITDNNKPFIFNQKDVYLNVGETYEDSLINAYAYDMQDGDLTGDIVINSSAVDTSKAGIYPVALDVVDSEGSTASAMINVYVRGEMTLTGADVKIYRSGDDYTLDMHNAVGTGLYGQALTVNYDSTSSYTNSNIDTSIENIYPVVLSVTDKDLANGTTQTVTLDLDVIVDFSAGVNITKTLTADSIAGMNANVQAGELISNTVVISELTGNDQVVTKIVDNYEGSRVTYNDDLLITNKSGQEVTGFDVDNSSGEEFIVTNLVLPANEVYTLTYGTKTTDSPFLSEGTISNTVTYSSDWVQDVSVRATIPVDATPSTFVLTSDISDENGLDIIGNGLANVDEDLYVTSKIVTGAAYLPLVKFNTAINSYSSGLSGNSLELTNIDSTTGVCSNTTTTTDNSTLFVKCR